MIPNKAGVQAKLNALAETPEFQQILLEVIEEHNLVPRDVQQCVDKIYHEVSKHAHGNSGFILFKESEFTRGELGVLTSFFRFKANGAMRLRRSARGKGSRRREELEGGERPVLDG